MKAAAPTSMFTTRATQLIIALVVLAPALETLLGSRDLTIKDYMRTLQYDPELLVMRLATFAAVMLSVLIIGQRLLHQGKPGPASAVMTGLVAYYVTNVLISGALGEIPHLTRSHLYAIILFTALYMSRDDGAEPLLDAAKVSLLVMMVASLICLFAAPELTRRVYAPEVRLPFIDFRFWGLGASANGIGPLGLMLALLTVDRPFQRRWLTWLSLASAGLVVLLAQSQTTWIIAALFVPLYILHRSGRLKAMVQAWSRSPSMAAPAVAAIAIVAVVGLVVMLESTGEAVAAPSGNELTLTGRVDVWGIALDTFWRNILFGYGLTAWELEFRQGIGMLWAVHAHNQLLQALSVAGLVGGIGLLYYFSTLIRATAKLATATRGLAPVLLTLILVRCITEAPLDMNSALLGEAVAHLLLFRVLTSPPPAAESLRPWRLV